MEAHASAYAHAPAYKWVAATPLPPALTGVIVAVTLAAAYLVFAAQIGLLDAVRDGDLPTIALRANLTTMVLLGYVPVAHVYLRRWTAEHVHAIAARHGIEAIHRVPGVAALRIATVLGAAVFYGLFLFGDNPDYALAPQTWNADYALALVAVPVLGALITRFVYELMWNAVHVSRLAERLPRLDLLDPRGTEPFLQHGVRSALLVVLLLSIAANLVADPGDAVIGAAVNTAVFVVAGILVFALPAYGVHLRIRAQRSEELDALHTEIRAVRAAFADGDNAAGARLVALLALEARLLDVHEWPFDAGSLGRFGLYVMVGLGSWVGAALVERLLDLSL